METCCAPKNKKPEKNFLLALIYGLIPHTFCIAFVLFSIFGVTAGLAVTKRFLLIPYFFQSLVALSLIMATLSAIIYLKRLKLLSLDGLKIKWKYLTFLYSITLIVNISVFFLILPATANIHNTTPKAYASNLSAGVLKVQIPCPGHAPLIISEIKKESGVGSVFFKMPDIFEVRYDSDATSLKKIASLAIFKDFQATIQ